MTHIEYLSGTEEHARPELSFFWDRLDSRTIVISTYGYNHMGHVAIEEALIKIYGCRYAFDYCKKNKFRISQFDRTCGRTFTYLAEPKKGVNYE